MTLLEQPGKERGSGDMPDLCMVSGPAAALTIEAILERAGLLTPPERSAFMELQHMPPERVLVGRDAFETSLHCLSSLSVQGVTALVDKLLCLQLLEARPESAETKIRLPDKVRQAAGILAQSEAKPDSGRVPPPENL